MNLSEPFIRRPVMTTLVMIAILMIGFMAYNKLPVSNLPDVNYPVIFVRAGLPGASSETMANSVAAPLEREFMTISGITKVTSSNTLGDSKIVLQFDIDKSMDAAAQDVEAAISRARSRLPANLPNDPVYMKVNPSDTPIMYLALTSDTLPVADLYTYAHTFIGQRLSMLQGVAQVMTYGSPYAVRVQADPNRLASLDVTLEEMARALQSGNPSLPTGIINGPFRAANIIANGQLESADAYQPLVVAYRDGAPVRIQDLGNAVDGLKDDRVALSYVDHKRNQPTVVLAIQREPTGNTVKIAHAVKEQLPKLMEQLPSSVRLKMVFDLSESIEESIWEVQFTLVLAFFLVVLVIFLYLGKVADTVIPSLVLPMSIVATFIAMYLFGYTLDNLSLLALTLAIGFIVDDAIVVLENIVHRIEKGESPWQASLNGSKQISFTILSMTISLVAVFIPMLFMGGIIGKIFQEFAVTLTVVTLASGVISLTLTPMLCSRFIPPEYGGHKSAMTRLSEWFNDKMLDVYKPALQWVLGHRRITALVGGLSVILSGYLLVTMPIDFIPDDDIGFIQAYTLAEQGTSPEKMQHYQHAVADVIRANPNVASFVSISSYPQYHQGVDFIKLKPIHKREPSQQVVQQLHQELVQVPGVNTFLKNVPLIDLSVGTFNQGAYQYMLQGLHTDVLYTSAEKLIDKMQQDQTFQAVSTDLEIKTPQLNLDILRNEAATLGVDAEQIENTLLLAYSGNWVSQIQSPLDQYDVILELDPVYQADASSLSSIYVRSQNDGQLVPLNAVAKWEEGVGASSVNHVDQFPAVTIGFNVAPGIPLGTAIDRLKELARETLSDGVTGQVEGAAKTFEEAISSSAFLFIVAIFAIYIVLGILYESFIHPLTILSTLPPAVLGGLLTLYFLNLPLSLYAFLGLILLIGIVKKNGIMVVDYALDNIREKHESPDVAIYNACIVRFRPIMMTTIAAVAGAFPIAFAIGGGAAARRPLGLVIVGGMLFSQLITLFLTPVIYLYLEKLSKEPVGLNSESSGLRTHS